MKHEPHDFGSQESVSNYVNPSLSFIWQMVACRGW